MPIRVLTELLVNRIAAGEVIARPASVVKELVENAMDAGARRVVVEVGNGTRDIVVRDDGSGIARTDAPLALVRHATSKITEFDDLYRLDSRGFRGEALASIASVSRLQILTRRHEDIAGTKITAEGMGEPRVESAGAPVGTEVRVRELFFNTPARLKFLKSPSSELNQVLQTVVKQALIRPDIGFTVVHDRGTLIDVPPEQPWAARIEALLGSGVRGELLAVDEVRHDVHVRGFVATPAASRKDRKQQFFFVNGRPIVSRNLSFVLQEAFKGVIMVQRYPVCVLDVVLAPGEVDINVHPTKEEVRFRSESQVSGVLFRVVQAALNGANLMPVVQLGPAIPGGGAEQRDMIPQILPAGLPAGGFGFSGGGAGATQVPGDFMMFTSGVQTVTLPVASRLEGQAAAVARADEEFQYVEREERLTDAASPLPAAGAEQRLDGGTEGREETACNVRPILSSLRGEPAQVPEPMEYALLRHGSYPEPMGQVSKCYIIAQCGGDLLLIDQHAAHERLLYLKFSGRKQEPPTQPLLIPISVDVPAAAGEYMQRLLPLFGQLGLQIEPFGGSTYLVHTVPADLPNINPASVVADLLDDFVALGRVEQMDVLRDRIITRMACRAAVKAGDTMHLDEMRALIRDIANARLGFTCPHGRPTMILLTRDELDRQFKRKA